MFRRFVLFVFLALALIGMAPAAPAQAQSCSPGCLQVRLYTYCVPAAVPPVENNLLAEIKYHTVVGRPGHLHDSPAQVSLLQPGRLDRLLLGEMDPHQRPVRILVVRVGRPAEREFRWRNGISIPPLQP
jgi:hypothetical protein